MASYREITSVEQWKQELAASADKPLLLFKNSTICPISAAAREEFEAFLSDREGSDNMPEAILVNVIESRAVSNQIAEDLGIKHESPQVFLVRNGTANWHASHSAITYEQIESAVTNK